MSGTTITTTTAAPGTMASDNPPSNRPPADTMINEVFFDKKCAKKEPDHKKFYTWCASANQSVKTTCIGIGGSSSECQFTAEFINSNNQGITTSAPNSTDGKPQLFSKSTASARSFLDSSESNAIAKNESAYSSTITLAPPTGVEPNELPKIKEGNYSLHYVHICDMGGKYHMTKWEDTIPLNKSIFDDVTVNCYQELYGKPYGMPWWLIVLIVLVILAAICVAFTLFWRYWLRQRVYAPKSRSGMSRYTSAPFSSASSAGTSRASGARGSKSGSSRPSRVSSTRRLPSSSAQSTKRLPSNSQASNSMLPSNSQARSMYRASSVSRPGSSGVSGASSSRSSAARRPSQRSSLDKS